jgi:hypothetical protein
MPIIIKIFSDFCNSSDMKKHFENCFQTSQFQNYGPGKEIYITDGEDYTHVVLINWVIPILKPIPKENVIGLAYKPPLFLKFSPEFFSYVEKNVSKYFIGDLYDLPSPPFVGGYGYMCHILPPLEIPYKKNIMSIMVSEKNIAPGHKYRHILVQHILNQGLPIDIYGRGCELYDDLNAVNTPTVNPSQRMSQELFFKMKNQNKDPRLKGNFKETEPYATYKFHIAIENFSTDHYFSEKLLNTLFYKTTPIYFGCKNVDTYFPGMTIRLSGNVYDDIDMLKRILQNPGHYIKQIDTEYVKQKTNFFMNLDKIFS